MGLRSEPVRLAAGESFRVLTWNADPSDLRVRVPDGSTRRYHGSGARWHKHVEMELAVYFSGNGTRIVGDSIERFDAPDAVLIGSNLPHCWRLQTQTEGVVVHFPAWVGHELWRLPETADLGALFIGQAARGIQLRGPLLARVCDGMRAMVRPGALRRLAAWFSVLDAILDAPASCRRPLSGALASPAPFGPKYQGIKKAVDTILESFSGPLDLPRLLEVAGMSRATFARQFRAHTGKTFGQFLRGIRLNSALCQLLETDLPVSEIAYGVGFESLSHFNHCFRETYGCNPGQARQRRASQPRPKRQPSRVPQDT